MKTSGRSLPSVRSPTATWRGVTLATGYHSRLSRLSAPKVGEGEIAGMAPDDISNQAGLIECGADEGGEQRVRLERFGLEFRVELHADIPGMIWDLDNLRQHAVRRHARKPEPGGFERLFVADIDLVAVAMTFADHFGAIDLGHPTARRQHRRVGAEPHRAAEIDPDMVGNTAMGHRLSQ